MPRSSDARQRAVSTTARLLQEQGYAHTGVTQILEESGAPKGSFYYHFPQGKEQLAIEALRASGEQVAEGLSRLAEQSETPAVLVDRFIRAEAKALKASGYRQGCPIATVALEMASESDAIQEVCKAVLANWIGIFRAHFAPHVGPAQARPLAEHTVMCLEGALLLSRVRRSISPLRHTRDRLCAELEQATELTGGAQRLPAGGTPNDER
jgi:TetR/AcrR family transcriptional regulator, lmrAB and yxaGH operons repressor